MLQVKNSERMDAVTKGTYVEMANSDDARNFLTGTLQEIMKSKLLARTKVLAADALRTFTNSRGANLSLQARPDYAEEQVALGGFKQAF
jgi:hypothetical protein